jgi:hypothetical protein
MTKTINIGKGMDLRTLTREPRIKETGRLARMCPGRQITRRMPSGIPRMAVRTADRLTM